MRFRLGTFLGNAQNTNEAFVANAKGEVIRTRAIVRVVEQSRWSAQAVLGVVGTPIRPRPSQSSDTDAHIEEFLEPHVSQDHDQPDVAPVGDQPESRNPALPKQQRITAADIDKFGYTDRCPRCTDLQAGIHGSKKMPSDECRLRM